MGGEGRVPATMASISLCAQPGEELHYEEEVIRSRHCRQPWHAIRLCTRGITTLLITLSEGACSTRSNSSIRVRRKEAIGNFWGGGATAANQHTNHTKRDPGGA